MNRRSLLTGALAFVAAPAIVRASSLMPVKPMAEMFKCTFMGRTFYIPSDGWYLIEARCSQEAPYSDITLNGRAAVRGQRLEKLTSVRRLHQGDAIDSVFVDRIEVTPLT